MSDTYPHQDGDFTVLGPEIFASADGAVICWKGENYVVQDHQADAARLAEALRITQEYIGNELLPPLDGWAWFDALRSHRLTADGEMEGDAEGVSPAEGDRRLIIMQEIRAGRLVEAATKPCATCVGTGTVPTHSTLLVGVGCDQCRHRGYYVGGGGGRIECPYCPTASEQPRQPCPKCGGSGTVPVVLVDRDALTWTIQKGPDQGGGVRVEAVTGPETERRTVVDRDALIGEIVEALEDEAQKRGSGPARDALEFALLVMQRRFAPGNREGQ